MIKVIKYLSEGTSPNTRRKGNALVGESTVGYGPTSETGFYNAIEPPEGGYTLYLDKESQGPSIYVFTDNTELLNFCNGSLGAEQSTIFGVIDWINTQDNYFVDPNYFNFTAEVVSEGTFTLPIQSTNTPTINCVVDWGDGTTSTITSWDSASKSHTYPSTGGGGGSTVVYSSGPSSQDLVFFDAPPFFTAILINDFSMSLPTVNVGDNVILETFFGTFTVTITNVFNSNSSEMNIECTGNDQTFIQPPDVISISVGGNSGPPTTYDIKIAGQISNLQFVGYQNLKEIKSWGSLDISLSNAFANCQSMTCTAVDSPRITTTSLAECFNSCVNFNGVIGNWDTSTITNMYNMFNSAQSFNGDISNWDVSNVTNMGLMFANTNNFNQDIGNWEVSNVTNMNLMFNGAQSFNKNISNWKISQVTDFGGFMRNVTLSTTNYDLLLVKWESNLQSVYPQGVGYPPQPYTIEFGSSKYTPNSDAFVARTSLINTYGWTITDGGQV